MAALSLKSPRATIFVACCRLFEQVLGEAGFEKPDAIAYTAGPGLVGALMVGSGMANGLGLAWNCPVMPVHHMEGHLLAPMLEESPPEYPFLALLVSGGHTMLIAVAELGDYTILGTTRDDAVGEAFDKSAKLLGLGYPGGPALAALAEDGDEGERRFSTANAQSRWFRFQLQWPKNRSHARGQTSSG